MTALLAAFCFCSAVSFAAQPRSRNTFLLTSDFHFNPMADASLVPALMAAPPTQWESILQRSKLTAFSQYGEDTNWWLLRSALDAMSATLPHPAFVMMTGDLLAHRFPETFQNTTHDGNREDYRRFVLKTVEFLALELRKRFPDAQILLTPGNNDDDCGDYTIEGGGTFLHDTAEVVRNLAHGDDQFRRSWEELGSYDMPNPAIRGVRIIALNSIFFSAIYHAANFSQGCAAAASSAPGDLLGWLESHLQAARQAHEKVWLMFHIPPGIDSYFTFQKYQALAKAAGQPMTEQRCASAIVPMWAPQWTAQFDSLLQKYADTVIAGFAAHTHVDDFRVINSAGADAAFVLINPAVSPVYNQNPAFRLVAFAPDGSLTGETTYYLSNLLFAGSDTPAEWKKEYTFSLQWKLQRLDAATLGTLYSRIKSQPAVRDEWLKLYNISSSAAHLPPGSASALYCAIEGLDAETYGHCYCSEASASLARR
ncbi:MAG TPA: hypothetical protein VKV05_06010 [Terriglobales bacterium]|nr:hypothetical protein [Terriglobales bacterium]